MLQLLYIMHNIWCAVHDHENQSIVTYTTNVLMTDDYITLPAAGYQTDTISTHSHQISEYLCTGCICTKPVLSHASSVNYYMNSSFLYGTVMSPGG